MAVNAIPTGKSVVLTLQTGVDENGNPKYKHLTYSGLKLDATDQQVWDFAQAIAGLQKFTLNQVGEINRARLVQA
ncbi:DUF1659 domain-containing protein [Desulfofundulus thermobenzoicus]|uniref:DUF1659 domain-containing protein n=1 Tax=Desulfofundulus thermobenzoicus TaxID=29376 RepID=A0A6N7IQP9_9FIRM|nr:DUF1659 domain-containing protein [Desulfofundulus thermobenzoicus]MQL52415.1 DUF1659 domain-containing protein [Desulfofundulus thermobenzoicus]